MAEMISGQQHRAGCPVDEHGQLSVAVKAWVKHACDAQGSRPTLNAPVINEVYPVINEHSRSGYLPRGELKVETADGRFPKPPL